MELHVHSTNSYRIPQNFIKWLHLVYLKPTANGYISDPFPQRKGMRQGCPLSSLLFALIMEHLEASKNGNTATDGWSIVGITEKFSLYANDILVYLADWKSSLESLQDMVNEFGSYSGLQVNWAKSVLYPIDDLSTLEISSNSRLLLVERFTYLGIVVHRDVRQFDELNLSCTMEYIT